MDVDHLHGGEFLQRAARGQSRRQGMQTTLERDLQAVRQERDEDMRFDPSLVLMEDRTDRQVALQVFERLLPPRPTGCSTATAARDRSR